jgi:ORF6N domain
VKCYDIHGIASRSPRGVSLPTVKESAKGVVPRERIEHAIYLIRSEKVMLSHDLASLYGVTTAALVQAVKRNPERFPDDFMFQLSDAEFANLISQTVTSSWGGHRKPPYAFTEQGVAMLSGVLRSERAVAANVEIMRTFVRLRRLLLSQEEMARKLSVLERRYDHQFKIVFDAIRKIMAPEIPPKSRRIGFRPQES